MSSSRVDLEIYRIPLEEIIRATKDFSSESRVGDGGFGLVYRGQLSEQWKNRIVAIKRFGRTGNQGDTEFHNELEMASSFDNPNIIPFIGYCDDVKEKIIVFDYATNGSLDYHLEDPNKRRHLKWSQRLKICLGVARGIKYLHSGVGEHTRVIHRDVKSGNILLDENLDARICDFGFSKLGPRNQPNTHVHTRVCGTWFYTDPIYNERRRLTKESDIYSFGVVMFEMASGMMAYKANRIEDTEEQYLIDLVRSYYGDHDRVDGLGKLIDPTIRGQIDVRSFEKFNKIAFECINWDIKTRPTIDRIIEEIEEALNIQKRSEEENWQSFLRGGKKCYLAGVKKLSIAWHDDPRYWELKYIPKLRIGAVSILKKVCWLSIHGKIASGMLSPNIIYVAYLVFLTTPHSKGLSVPAKTMVSFSGVEMETKNVYLQRPEANSEILDVSVQEPDVFPQRRRDKWMEIKLGEFECNDRDFGEVKMGFEEINLRNWKTGLIVLGMEVRPK